MDPEEVRAALTERAESVRREVTERWDEAPHERRALYVPEYPFPETPDDVFPWVALCLVTDDHGRVLLVQHDDHDYSWEPPGGAGEPGETPAGTARREVAEETGIECRIDGLALTQRLEFDYGWGVPVPVLQAVFTGSKVGGTLRPGEEDIFVVDWFEPGAIPEGTHFAEEIADHVRE